MAGLIYCGHELCSRLLNDKSNTLVYKFLKRSLTGQIPRPKLLPKLLHENENNWSLGTLQEHQTDLKLARLSQLSD